MRKRSRESENKATSLAILFTGWQNI